MAGPLYRLGPQPWHDPLRAGEARHPLAGPVDRQRSDGSMLLAEDLPPFNKRPYSCARLAPEWPVPARWCRAAGTAAVPAKGTVYSQKALPDPSFTATHHSNRKHHPAPLHPNIGLVHPPGEGQPAAVPGRTLVARAALLASTALTLAATAVTFHLVSRLLDREPGVKGAR
jgi:hypothetical protein